MIHSVVVLQCHHAPYPVSQAPVPDQRLYPRPGHNQYQPSCFTPVDRVDPDQTVRPSDIPLDHRCPLLPPNGDNHIPVLEQGDDSLDLSIQIGNGFPQLADPEQVLDPFDHSSLHTTYPSAAPTPILSANRIRSYSAGLPQDRSFGMLGLVRPPVLLVALPLRVKVAPLDFPGRLVVIGEVDPKHRNDSNRHRSLQNYNPLVFHSSSSIRLTHSPNRSSQDRSHSHNQLIRPLSLSTGSPQEVLQTIRNLANIRAWGPPPATDREQGNGDRGCAALHYHDTLQPQQIGAARSSCPPQPPPDRPAQRQRGTDPDHSAGSRPVTPQLTASFTTTKQRGQPSEPSSSTSGSQSSTRPVHLHAGQ